MSRVPALRPPSGGLPPVAPWRNVAAGQWPWWAWRPDPPPPPIPPRIDWWWGIPWWSRTFPVYVRLRPHYAFTRIPAYTNDDRMAGRPPWWRARPW